MIVDGEICDTLVSHSLVSVEEDAKIDSIRGGERESIRAVVVIYTNIWRAHHEKVSEVKDLGDLGHQTILRRRRKYGSKVATKERSNRGRIRKLLYSNGTDRILINSLYSRGR